MGFRPSGPPASLLSLSEDRVVQQQQHLHPPDARAGFMVGMKAEFSDAYWDCINLSYYPNATCLGLPVRTAEKRPGVVPGIYVLVQDECPWLPRCVTHQRPRPPAELYDLYVGSEYQLSGFQVRGSRNQGGAVWTAPPAHDSGVPNTSTPNETPVPPGKDPVLSNTSSLAAPRSHVQDASCWRNVGQMAGSECQGFVHACSPDK